MGRGRRWRLVRADSDAVPASARRFMRRARRRRLRAALPWALSCGLLATAGLAAWVVYGTGLFGVSRLEVVGVEVLSPAQVRVAAAVPAGTPLARVDLAAVRERVARLAPVDQVRVARDWPGTVVIEIVERKPVAAVPVDKHFALVDRTGLVFRTVASRPDGLPVLRVAAPGPGDPATRAAVQVLAALTPQLRERVVQLVAVTPARITLRLSGGRTVIWGDSSQGETKARVATALLDRDGETIDVSAPEVVTIR